MAHADTVPPADLSLLHLLRSQVLADPYPLYHRLRSESPAHWDRYLKAWVVTRYADVSRVLAECSAARLPSSQALAALGTDRLTPIVDLLRRQMLFNDPPQHSRLRALFNGAFGINSRYVDALRPRLGSIAEELLDRVAARGEMDVIADYAVPLPAIVIAEMLGLPRSDHVRLKAWADSFGEVLGNIRRKPMGTDQLAANVEEMVAYFGDPGAGAANGGRLVRALTRPQAGGDRLSPEEVTATMVSLLVGGQETTMNLIGNGLLSLLLHPGQMHRMREGGAVVRSAVDEFLRFESPTQFTARTVTEDMELHGRTLRPGDSVIAVLGAANRDPDVFADPDRLDVGRRDNRHLAFGWATHFCPGAGLTRALGQVAFETLLRRYPAVRRQPGAIDWEPNLSLRGLGSLHVELRS